MKKIFGTDGVRGMANVYPMTAEMALRLGQAAAKVFMKQKKRGEQLRVIIGKDTRISGYIFEYALTSGLCSMGAKVYLVGPMPTPAVALITRSMAADFSIVISASHNPSQDNGVKFFDAMGYKLPDAVEEEIEKEMENTIDTSHITGENVGKAKRVDDARGRYIQYVKATINHQSLRGLRVVLDCSNGAAYKVAPAVMLELGANLITINNTPDGLNINKDCGSLYPDVLKAAVLGHRADIGIALDGDADRVIIIDEKGNEIDGDHIISMCALDLLEQGKLKNNTVVVTTMSNLGFELAMKQNGINVIRTDVGDRYVIEAMKKNNYVLGGETSGHIIFYEHSPTGDGTLAALQVLHLMKRTRRKVSDLASCMNKLPQILVNVMVNEKKPIDELAKVVFAIKNAEQDLAGKGRIIVRYSGTEKNAE